MLAVLFSPQMTTIPTPEQIKAALKPLKKGDKINFGILKVTCTRRGQFCASDPREPGHTRFGRLNEIVDDIAHFLEHDVLPRSTPGRPW